MRIAFHTLGCKVNQYESEAMAEIFRSRGHEIVSENDPADVYIVNTCTVTAVADRKSRQYIRRMKKVNPDSIVAVTGCYAQISPGEITAIEGVDVVTGTNEKSSLPDMVEQLARDRRSGAEVERPAQGLRSGAECEWPARGLRSGAEQGQPARDSLPVAADVQRQPRQRIHPLEELDVYEDTGIVTSAENRTRAYIKIQEGCDRFCAYCVIPYARGPVRSRPLEGILEEARQLIASGYKEIVLTGINTALYGTEAGFKGGTGAEDAEGSGDGAARTCDGEAARTGDGASARGPKVSGIEPVIAAINDLEGDFRIRLSSLEPTVVDAEYVKRLLKYDRLCHHLHLSAQSGSDRVLKEMNRSYTREEYLAIVAALRGFDPHYGVSADIIAGFPGEKEADVKDSEDLIRESCLCRTHVFRYSRRPKTRAAERKDQVSPQVKEERSGRLQRAAAETARAFFEGSVGDVRQVLFEEYLEDDGMITGYTDNYIRVYAEAPEEGGLINAFASVRLDEVFRDGMRGTVLGR